MSFMKLKLGAAAAVLIGASVLPAAAQDSIYVPLLTYRTGPFAGSGIPIADGMHDYLRMLNERDGGIGGVKLAIEECETGYDTKKGVECYESIKGKNPAVVNPYSTGITLQLIPQGRRRQDPDPVHGLRPLALGRRQHLPLGLQPAGHLLGRRLRLHQARRREGRRPRQAQGQEDRADPPRRALRQGADPAARGACEGSRLRAEALSGRRAGHAEPGLAMAYDPPRPARLALSPGLGRHEPDGRQGGGQGRLPDGQDRRRLVGRRRRRRAWRRRRGEGLQVPRFPRRRRRLRGDQGHPEARRRQGLVEIPEGEARRESLQPRRLQLDADCRGGARPRSRSPARRRSTARTCAKGSRRSTSPRRA